jgi:hypothetical protein
MKMWPWTRATPPAPPEPPPAPPPATVTITTAPLVLGPVPDYVSYARYRIGAIKRHLEQNEVTDKWRMEVRAEILTILGKLHAEYSITPEEEHDALVLAGVRGAD